MTGYPLSSYKVWAVRGGTQQPRLRSSNIPWYRGGWNTIASCRQDSRPAADMQHPAPSLVMVDYDSSFWSCIVLICSLQYSSSPPASRLQPRVEQLYWGTFNWKPTAVWRFRDENIYTSNFTRKYFWNNFHLSLFVSRAGCWWLCDIFKFSLSVHWERECFALLGSSHSVHCTVLFCTVLYCTVLYCTVL